MGESIACPACRVVLDAGTACPREPTHAIVSLASRRSAARLYAAASYRRRRLAFRFVSAVVGTPLLLIVLGSLPAVLVFVAASSERWYLLAGMPVGPALIVYYLFRSNRSPSRGALRPTWVTTARARPRGIAVPRPRGDVAATGIARGDRAVTAPISKQPCLAYAVELHDERAVGGPITLREGRAAPFAIERDDGTVVQVAGGFAELFGGETSDASVDAWKAYARRWEPDPDHGTRAFPYTRGVERVLRAGDRVALRGRITQTSRSDAPYRAGVVDVCAGVPVLERLS